MIIPVILSGAAGTRRGPLSRERYPKPLLPLTAAMNQPYGNLALREAMGTALRARWQPQFAPPAFAARMRAFARGATGTTT